MFELMRYYPIGGVNLLTDELRIRDDEAVKLKNLFPNFGMKLEKRKGTQYHDWINDSFFGFDPQDLVPTNFEMPPFLSNSFITTLYKAATNTSYIVINNNNLGPAYTCVPYQNPAARRPAILTFGNQTLISAGAGVPRPSDECLIWVVKHNYDTGRLEFEQGTPPYAVVPTGPIFMDSKGRYLAPSVMARFRNRVVYGGFEAPYENYLVFSDNNQPTIITTGSEVYGNAIKIQMDTSARTVVIPHMRGDRITALVETAAAAVSNALDSQLLIMSENGAAIMYGEPSQTTELTAGALPFEVVRPQYDCGCVSQNTVARTPSGLIWAGWNDVWAMDWGGMPRRVGTKIRPVLMEGDPNFRHLWHAAYDHQTGTYRLAVPSPDQAEGFGEPLGDQWWLDVRDGIPGDSAAARWYGPQEYRVACEVAVSGVRGTYMMKAVDRRGDFPIILAPYMVTHPDSPTSARSLCYAAMDKQVGYDTCKPLYKPSDGTFLDNVYEEVDNEIVHEIVSKRFDLGDIEHDKVYCGVELGVWANDILCLEAEVQVDGGRQVDTEYIVIPQRGFALDIDPTETRETHEYQSVTINPDVNQRFTGKTFQVRVYDKPGVAIPQEDLGNVILAQRVGSPTQILDARYMSVDFYADILTYISNVAAILQTALGGTFVSSIVSNKVRLADSGGGANWFWRGYMTGGTPAVTLTAAQARASRKIGAIIGFQDANGLYYLGDGVGLTVNANVSVHRKPCAQVEIADMFIRVSRFRRRPSGGRYEASIP